MSRIPHRRINLLSESPGSPFDVPGLVCDIDLTDPAVLFSDRAGTVRASATSEIGFVLDKSGYNHHAIADSDAVRPHFENNITYFADSEKLTIANSTLLNVPNPTYVIVARYRALSLNGYIINKDSTNPDSMAIRTDNFRFESHCRYAAAPSTLITTNPLGPVDDTIRCHVVTKTETAFQHWVDSDLVSEDVNAGDIDTAAGSLVIGGHPDNATSGMEGEIYRVFVYDRSLTAGQIQGIARWVNQKYQYYTFVKQLDNLVADGVNIDGHAIASVGDTLYMMYGINGTTNVSLATASKSDPENWTTINSNAYASGQSSRGLCLVHYNSTFYFFYDDVLNGGIFLATGADLESLTVANGGAKILTGTGIVADPLRYARHPAVITPDLSPDGDWHMIVDGRQASPNAGSGALGHASAPAADVTNWTLDASPVLSPSGGDSWDRNDLTGTSIMAIGGVYELLFTGYNIPLRAGYIADVTNGAAFPHYLGKATSTDMVNWTQNASNPLGASNIGPNRLDSGQISVPAHYLDDKGREYAICQGTPYDSSGQYLFMFKRKL